MPKRARSPLVFTTMRNYARSKPAMTQRLYLRLTAIQMRRSALGPATSVMRTRDQKSSVSTRARRRASQIV